MDKNPVGIGGSSEEKAGIFAMLADGRRLFTYSDQAERRAGVAVKYESRG